MNADKQQLASIRETFPEQISDVWSEFSASLAYSGIQNPVSGLTQILDHLAGTKFLPHVQIFHPPEEASFGSGRWHAQQFGGALGSIIPFLVASRCVRGFAAPLESEAVASGLLQNSSRKLMLTSPSGRTVAENALSGFVADSTMRPSQDNEGNFWLARLSHGAVSAATFSALTASNSGLKILGQSNISLFKPFRNEIATAIISGIPAGLISAETSALLSSNRLASSREIGESIYATSVIGGGLSSLNYLGSRSDRASKPTEISPGQFVRNSRAVVSEAFGNLNNSVGSLLDLSSGPSFAMAIAGSGELPSRSGRFADSVYSMRISQSRNAGSSSPDLPAIIRVKQEVIAKLDTARKAESGTADTPSEQFQTQLKSVQKRLRELTQSHIESLAPEQANQLSASMKQIRRIAGSITKRSSHQYEQDTSVLMNLSRDLKNLREAVNGNKTADRKPSLAKAKSDSLSDDQVIEMRANLRRNEVNDSSREKLISVLEQHPTTFRHIVSALSNRHFKIQEESVGLLADKLERSLPAWEANRLKGDAGELYALKASQSIAKLLQEHSTPWIILKSDKLSSSDKAGLDAVMLNTSTGHLIPVDFTTNSREKSGSYKYHWAWSPSNDGTVTWQQLTDHLNQSTASPLKSMIVSDPLVNSTLRALSFGQRDSYHELKTALYLLEDNPRFAQTENAFRSLAAGIIKALGYEKISNSSTWSDKNQSSWLRVKSWLPELDR